MKGLSPIVRLSLGLVLMTISIFIVADMIFGFSPRHHQATMDARKKLTESLAVQFSALATRGDTPALEASMKVMVSRNTDLLSAALRSADGKIIAMAGDHTRHWVPVPGGKSTLTHAQVPIFAGTERWGTIEISFADVNDGGFWQFWTNSYVRLVLFIAAAGFAGYMVYLRRSLRHLDPSAVIPGRVRTALDALSEGVVLLDKNGLIVLVNNAFAKTLQKPPQSMLGANLAELPWEAPPEERFHTELPWRSVLRSGESVTARPLRLGVKEGLMRTFMVNATPILDDKGHGCGALATFDDVTDLERKNEELRKMLELLNTSQSEVRKQNEKLQIMATRDALTSCLNRRALFELLEKELTLAKNDERPLSCIMCDIDHFKSINDVFGHSTGDQVIRDVADVFRAGVRSIDNVGRYGGEEFCIVLPGADIEAAAEIAERLRETIESRIRAGEGESLRIVTSSFGVASSVFGAADPQRLVEQADEALYFSKNGGRNRVTRWDEKPLMAEAG